MPLEGERGMRRYKYALGASVDLATLIIRGFEGEGDQNTGGTGGTTDGGTGGDSGSGNTGDGTGDGDDTGSGDSTDDGDDGDLPDSADELKAALRKERVARRAAEKASKVSTREANRLKKTQDDAKAAEEGEVAAAKKRADESDARSKSLASKLRQSTLETAITAAARAQKFRDPDDVITQLQRNNFAGIEIDQDDEDPSDIDIDQKSVDKAVKAVATQKPHWLIAAGEGGKSGSSFNGGTPNDGKGPKSAEYASRFPALRNRMPGQ